MIYQDKPSLNYFSAVVKNVASPNIEIKKLVYIYILHHAESEPDLALLSINTIQKSLSDQNPQVRAIALRVMSGIRVPVISQIVSLAIKKGCADMSPHVRKAAALAIPKCYNLDPGTQPQLLDYISILLGDRQYYVVGSAVSAFLEICPERLDLIHRHFRGLTRKLVDMDEWGQLAVIKLVTYYSRKCFPRRMTRKKLKTDSGFYEDERVSSTDEGEKMEALDPDLDLFLIACKSLLYSRNAAVVVAVARSFLYLAPSSWLDLAIAPLIALLRTPSSMHQVVLYNIVSIGLNRPKSLTRYFSQFLVRAADSIEIMRLKLELLTLIFPEADMDIQGLILNELEHFTKSENSELVRESVRAIGRCSRSAQTTSKQCMSLLLRQASTSDGVLVAEALTVIRHLIQQDPTSHSKTIIRLAKNLDTMTNADARASIIWLVGEYTNLEPSQNIAPDVLRILLQGFANEAERAKLQIILLAAKVYLQNLNTNNRSKSKTEDTANHIQNEDEPLPRKHPIAILWNYALLLARYDTSYDLRDRSRMYKALFESASSTQLANLVLGASKPPPSAPSPSEALKGFLLGSASLIIGPDASLAGLSGYEPLPEWVKAGDEPDPSLRNEPPSQAGPTTKSAAQVIDLGMREQDSSQVGGSSVNNKEKSLDDWLAEAEKVESSSEENDVEEEESEESTDSEDEDTDENNTEDEEKGILLPP